jgi:biotin operon repressor
MAKQILITAKELMKISIWKNAEQLRQARGSGKIKMVKNRWYDLNKIHPAFIVKQTA